jgi:Zn-dependent oligopeptidase
MFETRFKEKGLLNPKVGLDFRNCILRPGGSKDALDMLRSFLSREADVVPVTEIGTEENKFLTVILLSNC